MKCNYKLLDSGNLLKLEEFSGKTFLRPTPYAVWKPHNTKLNADHIFVRESDKKGHWKSSSKPTNLFFESGKIRMSLRLTEFGHLGVFPEQIPNWNKISELVSGDSFKILNLFAYTGGSSIVAALSGAEVTHVDSVQNVNDWARENAELSGVPINKIRWITDDAQKFIKRELNRGHKYNAIILDPPTFGRGSRGEVFKIETDIINILEICQQLLDRTKPGFVMYTAHTPGFTHVTLKNQISSVFGAGKLESGEMNLIDTHNIELPSGFYCILKW